MDKETRDTKDRLAVLIEGLRATARTERLREPTHYDLKDIEGKGDIESEEKSGLEQEISKCEALFKADPETKERPKRLKPEKIDPKQAVLSVVRQLGANYPAHVSTDPTMEGSNHIARHLDALSVLRNRLDEYEGPKYKRPLLVRQLRKASELHVMELQQEIRRLREAVQPKRTVTLTQADNDHRLYLHFSEIFVVAARKSNADLPNLKKLADRIECYLSLLDYVDKVQLIAQDMKLNPSSLWDNHQAEFATELAMASENFKEVTKKPCYATPEVFQAFRIADQEICKAQSAHDIEVASEHLRHLALSFIMGGPPPLGANGKPDKERPHLPKILHRICDAYEADKKHYAGKLANDELRKQAGRMADLPERASPFLPSGLMDFVYAARWVQAADRVERLVSKHKGMLADPTIDTVRPEDKPAREPVGGIRELEEDKKTASKNSEKMRKPIPLEINPSNVAKPQDSQREQMTQRYLAALTRRGEAEQAGYSSKKKVFFIDGNGEHIGRLMEERSKVLTTDSMGKSH